MRLVPTMFLLSAIISISCLSRNSEIEAAMQTDTARAQSPAPFLIKRGINVSHWLSQTERTVSERIELFTERDVEFLASLGYDHIRLPVDEVHFWDENGNKIQEGFQLIHNAITWCHIHDLRIIIDLHIIRSHYFNSKENILWIDSDERQQFINLWLQLSNEFRNYSTSILAYELLNEAVAEDPADWNALISATIKAIREHEPERTIVVGSNSWQNPDSFDRLKVPEGDTNLILSFHFYDPHIFTHYRVIWESTGRYNGPVHYPGETLKSEYLTGLDPQLAEELRKYTIVYNRDSMLSRIWKPLAAAKETGLPLYCGEFGCFYSTAGLPDRLQWYADIRQVLESNNIAWANWDYKGGFAIFNPRTGRPDEELIQVLLGD